ncbi:MAG: J domain-containing protein [Treponema sp.]|nr:J domain-containing protein [Treponema sp.]
MSCWEILGIEPTDDKKQIKIAFAKKLKENPPDKDARIYQQIREAYNNALAESVYIGEEESNDDEVEEEEDEDEKFFAVEEDSKPDIDMEEINRLRKNMHFENARSLADLAGYINIRRWYFNRESDEPGFYHFLFILKLLIGIPGIIIYIIWMAI